MSSEMPCPDCGDTPCSEWTVEKLDETDIMVASWRIAELLLGKDDGSVDRDYVEVQIQEALKFSLSETAGRGGIGSLGLGVDLFAPDGLMLRYMYDVIEESLERLERKQKQSLPPPDGSSAGPES